MHIGAFYDAGTIQYAEIDPMGRRHSPIQELCSPTNCIAQTRGLLRALILIAKLHSIIRAREEAFMVHLGDELTEVRQSNALVGDGQRKARITDELERSLLFLPRCQPIRLDLFQVCIPGFRHQEEGE